MKNGIIRREGNAALHLYLKDGTQSKGVVGMHNHVIERMSLPCSLEPYPVNNSSG